MSKLFEVPADVRSDSGKGASRRLRREGLVPGIVYGGERDSASVQISHRILNRALAEESFYSSILELTIGDGRRQKVILRDLQRHPWKQEIMHIDFQRVSESELLRISVPLHFANEDVSPAGIQSGVVISHQVNEVEISCLPKDLPEFLEVNLEEMDVGDQIHLSDIELPEGVGIIALSHDDDTTVATAHHIAEVVEPTEEEELEAELGADEVPSAQQTDDAGDADKVEDED
jgi:large subunit ribosomal protein L25